MGTRATRMRLALALFAVALMVGTAHAKTVVFTSGDVELETKGCVAFTDGELLVPARVCAQLLSATLAWDESLNSLVFDAPPTKLTFFAGKNRVLLNGEEMFLTHKPQTSRGALLLPIGFLCETYGAKMAYTDADAITITPDLWDEMMDPEDRTALEVEVGGVPYNPEAYRCLPTSDQLRIAAAEVAEMFGGEVQWDRELRAACLTLDTHKIVFFEDKDTAILDGTPVEISRRPVMSKVELLIPFDSVCELLNRPLEQKGPASFVVGEPTE